MKKPNKKTPAQTAQTGQETSSQTGPSLHALDPVHAHELHNSFPSSAPSASSASSASSALNNSATTRCGGKPFQPLPEFASCSREQLDYLHDLIRSKTYDEAQQEIWTSLGCRISTNRLQRYRQKIDLAAALELAGEDTLPAVEQLNDLLAGRQTNIPAAGILLIQQRALALAAAPKTSPTLLKDLFRIFTYQDRKNDNDHRRKIAEERETTRQQTAGDRRAMNEHRKTMDLRRADTAEQREKTRIAAFEHQKQIDHHHARLAEQREQTRARMADLAERAQKHRERLASDPNSAETQDELTERANAIIAFGREFLRQEAASSCNADSLSANSGIQQPASDESNQQPEIINQK